MAGTSRRAVRLPYRTVTFIVPCACDARERPARHWGIGGSLHSRKAAGGRQRRRLVAGLQVAAACRAAFHVTLIACAALTRPCCDSMEGRGGLWRSWVPPFLLPTTCAADQAQGSASEAHFKALHAPAGPPARSPPLTKGGFAGRRASGLCCLLETRVRLEQHGGLAATAWCANMNPTWPWRREAPAAASASRQVPLFQRIPWPRVALADTSGRFPCFVCRTQYWHNLQAIWWWTCRMEGCQSKQPWRVGQGQV